MPEPVTLTARSARHGLPFLFAGQAQKEIFVNEALARLDALIQPVVLGEASNPPASAADGDSYIVATGAGGGWAGQDGAIATWAHGAWLFAPPVDGACVHDASTGALACFSAGTGWRGVAVPTPPAGGTTQDAEARAAIAAILDGLRSLGIFSS